MRRDDVHPPCGKVAEAVARALAEDLEPDGDLTSGLLPASLLGRARFVARAPGVLAGTRCAQEVCVHVDPELSCELSVDDGEQVVAGQQLGVVEGPLGSLLTAERSCLNFLCHLSGIATLTRRFVDAVAAVSPTTTVWDTRKTTPGLRALEKAAVRAGGGANHRGSLSEGVLIKDNHLGTLDIAAAVSLAKSRWPARMVEVECDRLDQVTQALEAGASLVLLDNMSPTEVARGVAMVRAHPSGVLGAVLVEASGGINLGNVADYAASGVDLISVGELTHSAPILDIGLDL